MISSRAIDRNNAPEKVMAILMIDPSLKHFMPEINLPKTSTSAKKTNIKIIFMISVISIFFIIIMLIHLGYLLSFHRAGKKGTCGTRTHDRFFSMIEC